MSSDLVLKIGSEQTPYFRTPEFSKITLENEKLMKEMLFADEDSKVIFLTGSGTSGMEATVMNVFTENVVLFAVAVQILQQKGRKQLPLHGVFELRTLAQPVVQGTLQRTVIARKTRSAQQILDLHVVRHGEAAPRQQPQQAAGRKRQEVSSFQPQSLLSVENSRLRIQYSV